MLLRGFFIFALLVSSTLAEPTLGRLAIGGAEWDLLFSEQSNGCSLSFLPSVEGQEPFPKPAIEVWVLLDRGRALGLTETGITRASVLVFSFEPVPEGSRLLAVVIRTPTEIRSIALDHRPICPGCGAREAQRIVYGKLDPARLDSDSFAGGCDVRPETWHCQACGHEW